MANTFILGGSPLGLIGVKSRPTEDGISTFNGGGSRNINVFSYNKGAKQSTNLVRNNEKIQSTVSLFTGDSLPQFWANISNNGSDSDKTGSSSSYKGINRNVLHSDEIYDTSILNIIEKLSLSPKASLRPQDFAYLKHIGVFPNNRLMIARRFPVPMKDNIMDKSGPAPLSVLISWKPQDEDFIDFSYGEEWTDADADFTDVLNSLGENFRIGGAGTGGGAALNAVPLPGFTETIQRKILENMGVLQGPDLDSARNKEGNLLSEEEKASARANKDYFATTPLPSGNPNIIKMAKRRKTIGYGTAGAGLKASISIKMKVEYEQKFISGIDPTIAWMDILNNALIFGTSNSDTYGLSTEFTKKLDSWTQLPGGTMNLIEDILDAIRDVFSGIKDILKKSIFGGDTNSDGKELTGFEDIKDDKKDNFLDSMVNLALASLDQTINKYKMEIMGIANALSGAPSTPWHITIGNPLRPVFCSGDMLVEDVKVVMGSTLAFNDLPSTMTVEFTLNNARPLGLQELLAKFNTGYLRVVNVRKDFTVSDGESEYYADPVTNEATFQSNGGGTTTTTEKTVVSMLGDTVTYSDGTTSKGTTTKENG